jgi:hypothetical protein
MPMTQPSRLALALAAACALAVSAPPSASPSCRTTHAGACAANGAACGPSQEQGRCETYRHRSWRTVQSSCACRVKTPHGTMVIP